MKKLSKLGWFKCEHSRYEKVILFSEIQDWVRDCIKELEDYLFKHGVFSSDENSYDWIKYHEIVEFLKEYVLEEKT